MFLGGTHHDQVQVFQCLATGHLKVLGIDIAVDAFIVGGDCGEGMEIAHTMYFYMDGPLDIHEAVEQDGVEAVFLREVLGTIAATDTIGAAAVVQFGAERTGILPCLFPSVLEVEVHQMLVAAQHLLVKLLLGEPVHPFIGNHRIFANLALTIEFCNGLSPVQITPPLDDER